MTSTCPQVQAVVQIVLLGISTPVWFHSRAFSLQRDSKSSSEVIHKTAQRICLHLSPHFLYPYSTSLQFYFCHFPSSGPGHGYRSSLQQHCTENIGVKRAYKADDCRRVAASQKRSHACFPSKLRPLLQILPASPGEDRICVRNG